MVIERIGAIQSMVWNIIKDVPEIGRKELLDKLLDLSLDYDESSTIINRLLLLRYLTYNAETGVLTPITKKR